MPAIQAAGEGYEVYVVTDASGGVSVEAHDMAIRRMIQAGVIPITWAFSDQNFSVIGPVLTVPAVAQTLLSSGAALEPACNRSSSFWRHQYLLRKQEFRPLHW